MEENMENLYDDIAKEKKQFIENFSTFKQSRIVLYGIGRLSQRLVPAIKDLFQIVGLLDKNETLIGGGKYGIPIISLEQAENIADIIIINTAEIYWELIYNRIKDCQLPVYYINGRRADDNSYICQLNQWYQEVYEKKIASSKMIRNMSLKRLFGKVCPDYKSGDKIIFSNATDYGYCIYGPIVYSYLSWIIEQAQEEKIEELLFLARDGYLLLDEYNEYLKCFKIKDAPKGKYIAASRRLVLVAGICDEESFDEVVGYSYTGTFAGYMKNRFDINIAEKEKAKTIILLPKDKERVKLMLKLYMPAVIKEIRRERGGYIQYLKNQNINPRAGIIDMGFSGRISYVITNLLKNKTIKTFYMYGDLRENNKYNPYHTLKGCFQEEDDYEAQQCELNKHRILNESIFTAPHGMMRKIIDNKIYYGKEKKDFSVNEEINIGIKKFIADMGKAEKEKYNSRSEIKKQALEADQLFGEIIRYTKCEDALQKRIGYDDEWTGD